MGMFDRIKCRHNLSHVEGLDDADVAALEYQTKDTPSQFLDQYEIREDGTLWVETYDIEDRSDPNAVGLMRICGAMTRVNKQWKPVSDFIGEIRFYTSLGEHHSGWLEFSAYFVRGKTDLVLLYRYCPVSAEAELARKRDYRRTMEEWAKDKDLPKIPPLSDTEKCAGYENVLRLIASPMRPDGTWNRDRETCQVLAEEALKRFAKQ